jgi:hypothetical protein
MILLSISILNKAQLVCSLFKYIISVILKLRNYILLYIVTENANNQKGDTICCGRRLKVN